MATTTEQTLHSLCARSDCGEPITITIGPGQRWDDPTVAWRHVDPPTKAAKQHRARPELRVCVDATCPGCGYPEIGFAPARNEFVCSRCQHTQSTRPGA